MEREKSTLAFKYKRFIGILGPNIVPTIPAVFPRPILNVFVSSCQCEQGLSKGSPAFTMNNCRSSTNLHVRSPNAQDRADNNA